MKKVLLGIAIGFVTAVIAAGVILRANFVYLDGRLYKRNASWLGLRIIDMSNTHVSELNKCKNLEMLYSTHMDSDDLNKMSVLEKMTNLTIADPDSDIKSSDIEKLNMFPELSSLSFSNAKVDFSDLRSESIKTIHLTECDVTVNDLKLFAGCPSLKDLEFFQVTIDDRIKFKDEFLEMECILTDSSCFSDLDSVKRLYLFYTYIEDISGILDMDSLEEFTVSKGFISEEDRKLLEDKGVHVSEI